MTADIQVNKPEPIAFDNKTKSFRFGSDITQTIVNLEAGGTVLIEDFYSNGLFLLKELHNYLALKLPQVTFKEQREYRSTYHKLSNRILIKIVDQQLLVKKAPSIGWLKKLYGTSDDFLLSFPQIQGLNSAWQYYENGVVIPVLRNRIHPFYGTYFPTRFNHLILFDNWLLRYKVAKKTAMDVGFGCGVLSLQMIKHGFQKVFGTDSNPNAVIGFRESMNDTKLARKIELDFGHLFGKWVAKTELIVFNPPWMPQSYTAENLDSAIYYNETLFPDFFEAAKKRLLPKGKLLLLFSNIAQLTDAKTSHPIEKELELGGRFQLENCFKKSVKLASKKTKRNQTWRAMEKVELWVLVHN